MNHPDLFDWPAMAARAAGRDITANYSHRTLPPCDHDECGITRCNRDITANRHKGNAESVAAWERIAPTLSEARAEVLCVIGRAGARGLTCKEAAEELTCGMNTISGRFTELKRDRHIEPTGEVRDGSRAYKAAI